MSPQQNPTSKKSMLVLGASSPTGQRIVLEALRQGWRVTVFGRSILPVHKENLKVTTVEGDIYASSDEHALLAAMKDQSVIISALDPSSASAYRRVFSAMRHAQVSRIIALSTTFGFGVYDTNDRPDFVCSLLVWLLWTFGYSAWRSVVEVGAAFDAYGHGLDWTLARIGFVRDGPATRGRVAQGYVGDKRVGVGLAVNRADVAWWAVHQAGKERAEWVRMRPAISSV